LPLSSADLAALPSPFYRVAAKALIFDDQNRLLLAVSNTGRYEIPGGGWEHDESFEECLRREIQEELGVAIAKLSPIQFVFQGVGVHGWHVLRLVARVEVDSYNFRPADDMVDVQFVTKAELLAADNLDPADVGIRACIDHIWPQGKTDVTGLE
jgi:8-oxo-dGTP pyrophosphatase MutT (NUDIX family)